MTNTTAQAPAGLKASEQKALAALADHSGATASEIAAYAGIGGSTAGKALTALEGHNLAYRERGEKDGGRKTADRWYYRPVETTPEHISDELEETEAPADDAEPATAEALEADTAPETAATGEPEAPAPAAAPAPAKRLARGDLRQKVYEYLEAHPTQEIGPSGLAKKLGRSAGAVANALAKLADHGQAELTAESPRRYRLAGQA
ncbi:helix-turn-helix domain-containing protein [Streptomyces sp. Edi4]|uniref:MarR family transcriptional regulator n=1 Tax=Streptomyces sp. Edi4 TaxID=3162527 RepID=UPI0033066A16